LLHVRSSWSCGSSCDLVLRYAILLDPLLSSRAALNPEMLLTTAVIALLSAESAVGSPNLYRLLRPEVTYFSGCLCVGLCRGSGCVCRILRFVLRHFCAALPLLRRFSRGMVWCCDGRHFFPPLRRAAHRRLSWFVLLLQYLRTLKREGRSALSSDVFR
jgi:hypothetical protein